MNLEEISHSDELPWGLHDAKLERFEIDWLRQTLVFDVRVKIDERQTLERRARVNVTGLVFCMMEAPQTSEIDRARGYDPMPPGGLEIDSCTPHSSKVPASFPRTPDGAFLHQFFVQDWNRSIYVCARDASLTWLDAAPVPVERPNGFHLPGDKI